MTKNGTGVPKFRRIDATIGFSRRRDTSKIGQFAWHVRIRVALTWCRRAAPAGRTGRFPDRAVGQSGRSSPTQQSARWPGVCTIASVPAMRRRKPAICSVASRLRPALWRDRSLDTGSANADCAGTWRMQSPSAMMRPKPGKDTCIARAARCVPRRRDRRQARRHLALRPAAYAVDTRRRRGARQTRAG